MTEVIGPLRLGRGANAGFRLGGTGWTLKSRPTERLSPSNQDFTSRDFAGEGTRAYSYAALVFGAGGLKGSSKLPP
jgi:hypothetical protein